MFFVELSGFADARHLWVNYSMYSWFSLYLHPLEYLSTLFQVSDLAVPFKCLPTIIGVVAATVALFNNFKIILVERGAGRNGSTVAVSCIGDGSGLYTAQLSINLRLLLHPA